jgi:hypothetical protein
MSEDDDALAFGTRDVRGLLETDPMSHPPHDASRVAQPSEARVYHSCFRSCSLRCRLWMLIASNVRGEESLWSRIATHSSLEEYLVPPHTDPHAVVCVCAWLLGWVGWGEGCAV